jgi:ABC-type phosphate transport system substrate-binding protein
MAWQRAANLVAPRFLGITSIVRAQDVTLIPPDRAVEITGTLLWPFILKATTTDEGFADLLANETNIVMAQREIRAAERQRAHEAGMGDLTDANLGRILALDAIVPVVSNSNPVDRISMTQLAGVMSGQIANWADLDGPDAPISVHLPTVGSGLDAGVRRRASGATRYRSDAWCNPPRSQRRTGRSD